MCILYDIIMWLLLHGLSLLKLIMQASMHMICMHSIIIFGNCVIVLLLSMSRREFLIKFYLCQMFLSVWSSHVSIAQIQGIHRHPFGTTSVRTAPLVKKDEVYMPGPAHYQRESNSEEPGAEAEVTIQPANLKAQKPKKSFMFSSTSKRLHSPPSIITVSTSWSLQDYISI